MLTALWKTIVVQGFPDLWMIRVMGLTKIVMVKSTRVVLNDPKMPLSHNNLTVVCAMKASPN